MKKLITLGLFVVMLVGVNTTVNAQRPNRCDRNLQIAKLFLERADDCQEVGEGIFNQLAKAQEYYADGECKKGDKMLQAACNALTAKTNKARRDYIKARNNQDYTSCDYRNYRNLVRANQYLNRYKACAGRCR